MQPFSYLRVTGLAEAVSAGSANSKPGEAHIRASTQYLAGGTTLLDLAKLDVMQPALLIDINSLADKYGAIIADATGLKLGALVRMAEAENHPLIKKQYPVISDSLMLAASPQLRNMASLGGNVLQRTRCNYFRDPKWQQCNKRNPGSGCAAMDGVNRRLAVLGTSDKCIANYAGDFAQALIALDATVDIMGSLGPRTINFEDLHTLPGNAPEVETTLKPAEIITGYTVPAGAWTGRSLYLKIRDRQSYDFALASTAVALDMDGDTVRQARIALGGVAAKPWRAREAEAMLAGKTLTEAVAGQAAEAAFVKATPRSDNWFKVKLGQQTIVRALMEAKAMEL